MIPQEFPLNPGREEKFSIYGFREKTLLASFVPKKNNAFVLVSKMYHVIVTNAEKQMPVMIYYYNDIKASVDVSDMKYVVFSSSRKTRWPLAQFYRIVNISSVNFFILYLSYKDSPKINQFYFIKQLSFDLIVPYLQKRLSTPSLPQDLKETIKNILTESQPQVP